MLLFLFLCASAVAQISPLDNVSFEQKLGQPAAIDATFADHTGKTVTLGQLVHDRPVILMMGFYNCPMLCDPILKNLASSLKRVELSAGKDFDVIAVSINPDEKPALAAGKRDSLIKAYGRPGTDDGWQCLTGDLTNIEKLATSVGYHYAPLPGGQFSHPAGLILLTPDGKIDRYLIGMTFQGRDLRLALVETSAGKIGTFSDAVLLRCYHYDPATGRYGFAIQSALRGGGILTATLLFSSVVWMSYRYRQRPENRA